MFLLPAAGRLVAALTAGLGLVGADSRVVVITPHNASICVEFGRAFAEWHHAEYGERAVVEWRNLGGTADALKFVQSEFASKPDGIGLDCFFGGGPEPYLLLAEKQLTQPYRLPPEVLAGIPQHSNGVEIYDPDFHWYGAALSSFGIVQNTRLQRVLGLPAVTRWEQLADPRLFGWVGVGDPRNSGTMNNMFEAFLQAYGWERGWELLTAIAGNTAKFDRLSSTTAKDVSLGEAVYGFAIDFYGFTQVAVAGRTNMTFVLPEDFTAVSPDGICILKGAPHRTLAERFVRFVMDEPGQKLWFLPRGHPEGPRQFSIERMVVRPDFYRRYRDVSNIAFSPFDLKQPFRYDPKLASERRHVVAALAGALLVDTHSELRRAWRAMIATGDVTEKRAELGSTPVTEDEARRLAREGWKDPALRNRLRLAWQRWAQQKYRRIEALPTERCSVGSPAPSAAGWAATVTP
ncbi:MAG: ABC transporter substrate-binding protein [Verrucomicrobia bacterium]|nr:ABC transporter substrate-binding protein [Verrucomicrobiota bacterium]